MGKPVGSSPSVAPRKQPRKQPRELQGLGPILPYGPTHRGPTVTARKSTGPPAPKPPPGFRGFGCSSTCSLFDPPKMQANRLQVEAAKARGRPLKSNEAAGRSLASVARPPWQPQWTWLPLDQPRPRARVATGRSGCSHRSTGRLFPCRVRHNVGVPWYHLAYAQVCLLRPCYVARVSATLPLVEEGKFTVSK